ncbi:MAG: 2Fe-2S iron-sulfur cluster binding domain-containing protein [Alphaproteobacteria bacterium]|jgi:NAD(P)H-flavin reductase/ferredoxin|nr:2Fe-2S iron-sulfur cluster binding domain-containing protein [Alphaproteobacteria bacterium]
MATITYGTVEIGCNAGESVLSAFERASVDIPYSCRNGTCLSCMMRATSGPVSKASQKGIRPTLAEQGYFLACQHTPTNDLTIARPDDAQLYGRAMITAVERPTATVTKLRLQPANDLFYHAGQFINLRRADGLVRSYSIASVPRTDPEIELHIKRLAGGIMSTWACDQLQPGEAVDIQGPNGDCYYLPGKSDQTMLLIGNGTGAAPLIGIARDALLDGHHGPVHLYHGTRHPPGLYLDTELQALANEHDNFFYHPCISGWAEGDLPPWVPAGTRAGRAEDVALTDHSALTDWRIYLCGYPPMVQATRTRAYLAGAAVADILADAFELRDLRHEPRA